MCLPSASVPKDNSAEIARQEEAARQARITEGEAKIGEAFGQFDDPFYASREKSYTDYYFPQLEEQYNDARRKLVLSLAGSGNLNSGSGAGEMADLTKAFETQRSTTAGSALDFGNTTRSNVEAARQELIAQNRAAADPSAAASSAMARAGVLTPLPAFSPLGDIFASLISSAAIPLAAESKGYPGFKTGLFSADSSAVRTVK